MEIALPIGAVFTSLVSVLKYGISFSKYNYVKGYYYVCSQQERKFVNSPEGVPNFMKIQIGWLNPFTLKITSKDFDKTNFNRWKTWTSEVDMKGRAGSGSYIYDIGNETGQHEIVLQDKNKIVVRVIDKGKADWKRSKDNEPASQVWIRVNDGDPMLKTFKKLLP